MDEFMQRKKADENMRQMKKVYTLLKTIDKRLIAVEAKMDIVHPYQAVAACLGCDRYDCPNNYSCNYVPSSN